MLCFALHIANSFSTMILQVLIAIALAVLVECQRTTTIFKVLPPPVPTFGPAKPLAAGRGGRPYMSEEPTDTLRPLNAHVTRNNPMTVVYAAYLKTPNGLNGRVTAQGGPGGTGVRYRVDAYGLYSYGPFCKSIQL
jgi:hypothetical protein